MPTEGRSLKCHLSLALRRKRHTLCHTFCSSNSRPLAQAAENPVNYLPLSNYLNFTEFTVQLSRFISVCFFLFQPGKRFECLKYPNLGSLLDRGICPRFTSKPLKLRFDSNHLSFASLTARLIQCRQLHDHRRLEPKIRTAGRNWRSRQRDRRNAAERR